MTRCKLRWYSSIYIIHLHYVYHLIKPYIGLWCLCLMKFRMLFYGIFVEFSKSVSVFRRSYEYDSVNLFSNLFLYLVLTFVIKNNSVTFCKFNHDDERWFLHTSVALWVITKNVKKRSLNVAKDIFSWISKTNFVFYSLCATHEVGCHYQTCKIVKLWIYIYFFSLNCWTILQISEKCAKHELCLRAIIWAWALALAVNHFEYCRGVSHNSWSLCMC